MPKAWKRLPGARVRLTAPPPELSDIDPTPLPVGSMGTVERVCEDGTVYVLWDVGLLINHHEGDLDVVRAAPRKRSR